MIIAIELGVNAERLGRIVFIDHDDSPNRFGRSLRGGSGGKKSA